MTHRRTFVKLSTVAAAGAAAAALLPGRVMAGTTGKPDVLVLGAGLAGLNAALLLEEAGFRVQVVEGTRRIGGRLYTVPEAEVPGHPELGGSGIGGHYARILDAAKRFDVPLTQSRPRTEARKGDLMYHVAGTSLEHREWVDHPLNPFKRTENRTKALNLIQYAPYSRANNPLPRGDFTAWQDGDYQKYDISVWEWLRDQGMPEQAIKLGAGTNMSYGTSPHDLSVLMGFQNANLINSLYTGKGAFSSQGLAGAGGNQRIPEGMAQGLKSEIAFNQHVRSIHSNSTGTTVTTADNKRFTASFCICTFPFSALRHVQVTPNFTGLQAQAVHELGYCPVFQAHFVPTRPFWEQDKLPPSLWTDRTPGRFMALRNDAQNQQRITSYVAYVNGEMATYLERMSPQRAANTILKDLELIRPATKGALKLVKVFSWTRQPFAGGSYAYWKPGQISRFAKHVAKPVGRLHLAGEHTAVVNRGMEGAMESGERAAFEVLNRLA